MIMEHLFLITTLKTKTEVIFNQNRFLHLFLVLHFILFVPNLTTQQYVSSNTNNNYNYNNANNNCYISKTNVNGEIILEKCTLQEDIINFQLQKALANAWEDYGPNSKYRVTQNNPAKLASISSTSSDSNIYGYNQFSNRDTITTLSNNNYPSIGIRQSSTNGVRPSYNNFQPVTSEWDQNVLANPLRHREVVEPGFFSRILSQYVSFEINHHEIADLFRQVAFGLFIGVIIFGWIVLGFFIGFLPLKWLLLAGRNGVDGKDIEGSSSTSSFLINDPSNNNNDILRTITERVLLALDGDWLKKLEEKVQVGNKNGKWLKTHVHCCILPDDKAQGTVDCELIRRGRKTSTFKCLSDLIYNFQFGPNNNLTSEDSETNRNGKSSSNNSQHKELIKF